MIERYESLSEMQQKAVRVLAACAAAVLLTLIVTIVAVKLTSAPKADIEDGEITEDYNQEAFTIDENSSAILAETGDAGDGYLKETLFVGDSNTVRMYNYGMIGLQQFVGVEGLGIQSLTSNPCVFFKDSSNAYTIPQAISMMKPRRIIITMGTNNVTGTMDVGEFITEYRSALTSIKSGYSYCEIIVAAIPPVPANHSNYPNMKMQLIDEFNQALLEMCEQDGYSFLNTSELFKGDNGFGKNSYFAANDIHYSKDGIEALLKYVRTHASDAADKRPDTSNIPTRAQNPASTGESSSSETEMKANYYVEGGAGYIDIGTEKVESASFDVTEKDSITVTAVPKDGYVFLKWSDGVTEATRTDKGFKQSLSVTAMFNSASYSLSLNQTSVTITEGESITLKAALTQGNTPASAKDVIWTVNDEQQMNGESFKAKFTTAGTYKVIAYYHASQDKTLSAECIVVVNKAVVEYTGRIEGPTTVQKGGGWTYKIVMSPDVDYSVKWTINGNYVGDGKPQQFFFDNIPAGNCIIGAEVDVYGTVVSIPSMTVTVNEPETESGEDGGETESQQN